MNSAGHRLTRMHSDNRAKHKFIQTNIGGNLCSSVAWPAVIKHLRSSMWIFGWSVGDYDVFGGDGVDDAVF